MLIFWGSGKMDNTHLNSRQYKIQYNNIEYAMCFVLQQACTELAWVNNKNSTDTKGNNY